MIAELTNAPVTCTAHQDDIAVCTAKQLLNFFVTFQSLKAAVYVDMQHDGTNMVLLVTVLLVTNSTITTKTMPAPPCCMFTYTAAFTNRGIRA